MEISGKSMGNRGSCSPFPKSTKKKVLTCISTYFSLALEKTRKDIQLQLFNSNNSGVTFPYFCESECVCWSGCQESNYCTIVLFFSLENVCMCVFVCVEDKVGLYINGKRTGHQVANIIISFSKNKMRSVVEVSLLTKSRAFPWKLSLAEML